MYEPLYLPKMKKVNILSGNVSYAISYSKKYKDLKSNEIESLHMHGYTEFFFSLSNDISFFVDGKLYSVGVGEAIVSLANEIHVCNFNKPKSYEYFCFWVEADNPCILECIPKSKSLSFDEDTKDRLFSLLFQLNSLTEKEDEFESSVVFLQVLEILKNSHQKNYSKTAFPEEFQQILNYINENFLEIKTVKDIADKFFISSTTLLRSFNKYLNITPRKYLEQVKLSLAVELLNKGETVTDACLNSGFSDVSHFIVLFKKKFSVSPFKYKERRKKF